MKKLAVLTIVLFAVLSAPASHAAFPPVPEDAAIYPVEHFTQVALMYSWAEGGELYVHFRLLSERFFVCDVGFSILQNGSELGNLSLLDEDQAPFCGYFDTDRTFMIEDPFSRLKATEPFTLELSANRIYTLDIMPMSPQADMPENGIWREANGKISFYLQKYENKSAAVVATTDGCDNIIFIDPDYTDGLTVSNDLGKNGYSFNLILVTRTSGIAVARMPKGTIIENVSVAFLEAN
ncbi:MAG: hypothetical protein HY788_20945 [Deltaproteobacteria bacterium]|nr:hypothetical protein [Deltaproteobacteria bacterium]